MHAAVLRSLGKPPRCDQFPDPVPRGSELIVHVRAASPQPVDKQLPVARISRVLASCRLYVAPTELATLVMARVCSSEALDRPSPGGDGRTEAWAPRVLLSST
jgi:hypothetical protein